MSACKCIFLTLCAWCLAYQGSSAQNNKHSCIGKTDSTLHKFVYTSVDQMPEPEGGFEKLITFLLKNIKVPANSNDYFGTVIVSFVVESNGKLNRLRIVRDASPDHKIGKQFFKLAKMVKWKSGLCNGVAVPVVYSIPLRFEPSLTE